ncbi:hypothetical protein [Gorillibacterium sp. sgz5001074]|uniref:hypothetical protein n=1 Tax=Gorillibacterium sp. sgz5001074 TaxID=3446695 RepID=UPI003F66F0B0
MNGFFAAVSRINLLFAFIILFAGHLLMYYVLGTDNWPMVALSAALVETAVIAALQLYAGFRRRAR